MRHAMKLGAVLVWFVMACGDDGQQAIDAPQGTIDATDAPAIDAPAIDAPIDAPVVDIDARTDAAVVIDAADASTVVPDAMLPDAPTTIDGGATGIPAICMRVCTHVYADCFMTPVDPGCEQGCVPDLADCSPAQLMAVDACSTVACPGGDPTPVADCIGAVACVQG